MVVVAVHDSEMWIGAGGGRRRGMVVVVGVSVVVYWGLLKLLSLKLVLTVIVAGGPLCGLWRRYGGWSLPNSVARLGIIGCEA